MARRYESSPTALNDLYGMYNPFAYPREYTQEMANRMMSMMDHSIQRGLTRYFQQNQLPELQLADQGTQFLVKANVYGYEPQDLLVEHKNGYLTISGHKKTSSSVAGQFTETSQSFTKTIRAPVAATHASDVRAELKNGMLTVSLPKV